MDNTDSVEHDYTIMFNSNAVRTLHRVPCLINIAFLKVAPIKLGPLSRVDGSFAGIDGNSYCSCGTVRAAYGKDIRSALPDIELLKSTVGDIGPHP